MHLSSSPAYSINPLPKLKPGNNATEQSISPGPGAYNMNTLDKNPSWKIGKEKRNVQHKQMTPGPGEYFIKREIGITSGVSLKSRHHEPQKNSDIPGPGSYDPLFNKIRTTDPAYRIPQQKQTFDSHNNQNTPGPGQYNPKQLQKKALGTKFGKQLRNNSFDEGGDNVPGPGKYDFPKFFDINPPKYSFGTSKRNFQKRDSPPGPGTYQLEHIFQKKSGIKLRERSEYIKNHTIQIPGPGSYDTFNVDKYLKNNPSYSFRKRSDQNTIVADKTPGPLDYTISESIYKKNGKITIGKSKRINNYQGDLIPGPGSYPTRSIFGNDGPKFTMPRGKTLQYNSKKLNVTPGPGQYNSFVELDKSRQNSIQVSFTKAPRIRQDISNINPGPGNYEIKQNKSPSISFGTSKRIHYQQKQKSPGPGTYNLESTIANLSKYTLGQSKTNKNK